MHCAISTVLPNNMSLADRKRTAGSPVLRNGMEVAACRRVTSLWPAVWQENSENVSLWERECADT